VPPPHQRHPKSGRGGAAGTYLLPMGAWIHVRCADVVGVAGRGLTFACTAALQLLCTSEQTFVCTPLEGGDLWLRGRAGSGLAAVRWRTCGSNALGRDDHGSCAIPPLKARMIPQGATPEADTTRQGSVTRHRPSALSHAVSVPRPRARPGQWSHDRTRDSLAA